MKVIKQETLKEVVEKRYNHNDNKLSMAQKISFMEGAKWQQEITYSEEEVICFAKWCAELKVYHNETYVNNTFETLFEKFKNK